jgi:preprotein translocase subunit SecE
MADNKNINKTEGAEATKVEKTTKSKDAKPNIFTRAGKWIVKFLKDTKGELKKVVWTSKSEVWKSLQLVIAAVVVISAIILLIDTCSSYVINFIAGLIG